MSLAIAISPRPRSPILRTRTKSTAAAATSASNSWETPPSIWWWPSCSTSCTRSGRRASSRARGRISSTRRGWRNARALSDWIGSHTRAFAFLGGVPELVVPDNLRSGVTKAHRYEPDPNPTYQDMATHYGVAVLPARVRRPRDKAKVESGVLVVERWILAALRHRAFFSLAQLNEAIAELLKRLNNRQTESFKYLMKCHPKGSFVGVF